MPGWTRSRLTANGVRSVFSAYRSPCESPSRQPARTLTCLVRDGLCIKTPTGVIVPTEVLMSEKVTLSDAAQWTAFWKMINELKSLDFDFAAVLGSGSALSALVLEEHFQAAASTQPPRRLVSRVMSEFYLNAIVEATAPHREDWVISTVSSAVMSRNSATWSLKADEAWRYARADTPPPDHLRTPATIADVAKLTGLGKEMVRRKLLELISAGRVIRAPDGFLINMDYMQGPESRAGGAAIVTAFYRMIYDLTALGVAL